jgi:TRAP-type transport system periplasmic protein
MTINIRFGGYQGDNSVHTRGAKVFCEALTRLVGDQVKVIFHQNIVQDGHKASALLPMTESGDLEGCYFSSSYLADRVPELALFDQHFAVPDRRRAYAVLDGSLGARLAAEVEANITPFWAIGITACATSRPAIRRSAAWLIARA